MQATTETILARAPEVILEVRGGDMPGALETDMQAWSRLGAVPAVRTRRVYFLTGPQIMVPGPRVAEGIEAMAKVLHP
jgi:iron complex transport system substrate-binding protein